MRDFLVIYKKTKLFYIKLYYLLNYSKKNRKNRNYSKKKQKRKETDP